MSTIMKQEDDNVNHKAGQASDEVLESLQAVMHALRAHGRRALSAQQADLAPMEAKALGYFVRHPGATQSDLVAHSGRDKAQIARLIAKLRERGLLDVRSDAADRRSVCLEPTARARAIHAGIQQETDRIWRQAVAGFSAAESGQLAALLERIRLNLG